VRESKNSENFSKKRALEKTVIKNSTETLQRIGKMKLLDTLDCAVALYLASTLSLDQTGDVFNYTGVSVKEKAQRA